MLGTVEVCFGNMSLGIPEGLWVVENGFFCSSIAFFFLLVPGSSLRVGHLEGCSEWDTFIFICTFLDEIRFWGSKLKSKSQYQPDSVIQKTNSWFQIVPLVLPIKMLMQICSLRYV